MRHFGGSAPQPMHNAATACYRANGRENGKYRVDVGCEVRSNETGHNILVIQSFNTVVETLACYS